LFASGVCGLLSSLKNIDVALVVPYVSTPGESMQIADGEEIPFANLAFFLHSLSALPLPLCPLVPMLYT
jgi:hypothetical protein